MKAYTFPIEVRFADIDAMGHVNNALYLTYFEIARMKFFAELLGADWHWSEAGILVARNEIDYIQPVRLGDRIEAGVKCLEIGRKSFTLGYELRRVSADNALCTKGQSVLVCFDYTRSQTVPVFPRWRELLTTMT